MPRDHTTGRTQVEPDSYFDYGAHLEERRMRRPEPSRQNTPQVDYPDDYQVKGLILSALDDGVRTASALRSALEESR